MFDFGSGGSRFQYLGHTFEFWLELLRKAEAKDEVDLIQEIATLKAKVSFYESRIKAMNDFMGKSK